MNGIAAADLTWSRATASQVDIYRNNVRITSTPNDGSHTDAIGEGHRDVHLPHLQRTNEHVFEFGVSEV